MTDRLRGTPEPLAVDVKVRCQVCRKTATRVQLIPPGKLPWDFETWKRNLQEAYLRSHDSTQWHFIYSGIEAGNGLGHDITTEEAALLASAFTEPLAYEQVTTSGLYDDAGFCPQCHVPYCFHHWDSVVGYGTCPRGHGKSLDPHWSPPFEEDF